MFKIQMGVREYHVGPAGLILALLLYVLTSTPITLAHATRIYKSIDANGNVTYSSVPPENAEHVEKMHVPNNYNVDSSSTDTSNFDQIKAAAEELEADRKQREQEREEAREKLAEKEATKPAEKPPEREIHYYPAYPPYYYPYPGRPRPPRPPHPRPRPPQPAPLPPNPPR